MKSIMADISIKIAETQKTLVRDLFARYEYTMVNLDGTGSWPDIGNFFWKIWPEFAKEQIKLRFNIQRPIHNAIQN